MWKQLKHRNQRNRGFAIEQQAASWLSRQGATVVEHNYRCRFGEIDLIMLKGGQLLFIEVRFREREDFGGAAASVTATKQRKIVAAAGDYLRRHPRFGQHHCRFDVIAATRSADSGIAFQWIQQAFTA